MVQWFLHSAARFNTSFNQLRHNAHSVLDKTCCTATSMVLTSTFHQLKIDVQLPSALCTDQQQRNASSFLPSLLDA
jgi:hypothetical protein